MGEMQFLNETGHTTLEWDVADKTSTAIAEAEFDKLLEEGYSAFKREQHEKESMRIDKFDPGADEITWVRPLRGG